jgi:hypothetical protein
MRDVGLDTLVKASRIVNAPARDARERNRRRLATRIAACVAVGAAASVGREASAITGGTAPGTVAGATAALSGGFAKWAVVSSILIALCGATGAGVYALQRHATTPSTLAVPRFAEAPLAAGDPVAPAGAPSGLPTSANGNEGASTVPPPAQATAATGPVREPRVRQNPAPASPGTAPEARSLEGELQLLRSARHALDTGLPTLALGLLDRYASEFPAGALKAEFQVERILALCAVGRVASARQARDEFIRQQPGSPLADQLKTTCGGGP